MNLFKFLEMISISKQYIPAHHLVLYIIYGITDNKMPEIGALIQEVISNKANFCLIFLNMFGNRKVQ